MLFRPRLLRAFVEKSNPTPLFPNQPSSVRVELDLGQCGTKIPRQHSNLCQSIAVPVEPSTRGQRNGCRRAGVASIDAPTATVSLMHGMDALCRRSVSCDCQAVTARSAAERQQTRSRAAACSPFTLHQPLPADASVWATARRESHPWTVATLLLRRVPGQAEHPRLVAGRSRRQAGCC